MCVCMCVQDPYAQYFCRVLVVCTLQILTASDRDSPKHRDVAPHHSLRLVPCTQLGYSCEESRLCDVALCVLSGQTCAVSAKAYESCSVRIRSLVKRQATTSSLLLLRFCMTARSRYASHWQWLSADSSFTRVVVALNSACWHVALPCPRLQQSACQP